MRAAVARVRLAGMMLSRIIVAALLTASAIIAAVRFFWSDIVAQPDSAAAFLGALAGAGGGLLAIIFGAVINAELNRRRDDRLRKQETNAMAIAFRAELIAFISDAEIRLTVLRTFGEVKRPITATDMLQVDIPAKPVYATNTHRLGGLCDRVTLSVVEAHRSADHIRHNVGAARASQPEGAVGKPALERIRRDFRRLIVDAAKAINALDAFLGDPHRHPDPEALAAAADPAEDPKVAPK